MFIKLLCILLGKIYDDLVTIDDMICALGGSKNNTPGPDGIQHHHHIKLMNDEELICAVRDFSVNI